MVNAAMFDVSTGDCPRVNGANGDGDGSISHLVMANASDIDDFAVDGSVVNCWTDR